MHDRRILLLHISRAFSDLQGSMTDILKQRTLQWGQDGIKLIITGITAFTLLMAGGPSAAWAFQGGEDSSEWPGLLNKRSGTAGTIQASLLFSRTLVSKFTESTGTLVALQYNFWDSFGVELNGALYDSSEASVLSEVREQISRDPGLSDMHQISWLAGASAVWVPLYGRISFASEWNPSFDLYLLAGVGMAGTRRKRDEGQTAVETTNQFSVGGGMRIYLLRSVAVRFDLRNLFYDDPDRGQISDNNSGQPISGFTNMLLGQLGVQVHIGG